MSDGLRSLEKKPRMPPPPPPPPLLLSLPVDGRMLPLLFALLFVLLVAVNWFDEDITPPAAVAVLEDDVAALGVLDDGERFPIFTAATSSLHTHHHNTFEMLEGVVKKPRSPLTLYRSRVSLPTCCFVSTESSRGALGDDGRG